jgi:hypothetical protein
MQLAQASLHHLRLSMAKTIQVLLLQLQADLSSREQALRASEGTVAELTAKLQQAMDEVTLLRSTLSASDAANSDEIAALRVSSRLE